MMDGTCDSCVIDSVGTIPSTIVTRILLAWLGARPRTVTTVAGAAEARIAVLNASVPGKMEVVSKPNLTHT